MLAPPHPSPHRHRASSALMLFAVLGAAAAWSLQLLLDYGLAAHRCYPADMPFLAPNVAVGWAYPLVAALNLAAIVVAILSIWAARWIWKREHESSAHHLLTAGEGRTCFLAMCGQLSGLGFLVAILFDTVAIYMVPQCFG